MKRGDFHPNSTIITSFRMPKGCNAEPAESRNQLSPPWFGWWAPCPKQTGNTVWLLNILGRIKNLCRLLSPAKVITLNLSLENWMEIFYCSDVRGCKGWETVQKQETPLLLGKQWTPNTKKTQKAYFNLRLFGKVIKKGCCAFLPADIMCTTTISLLLQAGDPEGGDLIPPSITLLWTSSGTAADFFIDGNWD